MKNTSPDNPLQNHKRTPVSNDEFIENWISKARKWKRDGIPLEVALENVKFEFETMRLEVNGHYHQHIQKNTSYWDEDKAQVEDIKSRYEHFVNSEMATLSEQKFAIVDNLLSRLNALKSHIVEMKNFMQNIKN